MENKVMKAADHQELNQHEMNPDEMEKVSGGKGGACKKRKDGSTVVKYTEPTPKTTKALAGDDN